MSNAGSSPRLRRRGNPNQPPLPHLEDILTPATDADADADASRQPRVTPTPACGDRRGPGTSTTGSLGSDVTGNVRNQVTARRARPGAAPERGPAAEARTGARTGSGLTSTGRTGSAGGAVSVAGTEYAHPGLEWLDDVACADMDRDRFFVNAGHVMDEGARRACMACPVWRECLIFSYVAGPDGKGINGGYFGGLSLGQRRKLTLDQALAEGARVRGLSTGPRVA